MSIVADFETTTNPEDCRVWAFATLDIKTLEFKYGNNINDFMKFIKENPDTCYFHNLKFDGIFIIDWLFRHGFTHVRGRKLEKKQFTTLISDMGQFYSINICFQKGSKREPPSRTLLLDSAKILPFSVDTIAKSYHLEEQKLKIDYDEYRPVGHILTDDEIKYIYADVVIVAFAIKSQHDQGLEKMTTGSNALSFYKKITGKDFERWFPVLKDDYEIRKYYKGAFTFCNPQFKGKELSTGIVLDVNSLYPWVMHDCMLPHGLAMRFNGCYNDLSTEIKGIYPLFMQEIYCSFKLKEGKLPTIQLKNNLSYLPTDYISDTEDKIEHLFLTNVDLKLFLEHYTVEDLEYVRGFMFRQSNTMFTNYVNYWSDVKITSKKEKNYGMTIIAKLMLNSLYGKLASNPETRSKIPYFEENKVKFELSEKEKKKPIYIPAGAFITSYAREKTIRSAQACYDRFAYADTDSLHLSGTEIPEGLDVDPYKLGAWKIESVFDKAKFLHAKCYIEHVKEPKPSVFDRLKNPERTPEKWDLQKWVWKRTIAGLPEKCHDQVTLDRFKNKEVFTGKLKPRIVSGGVVLEKIEFTIKG